MMTNRPEQTVRTRHDELAAELKLARREIVRLSKVDSHLASCMESAQGFVLYRLAKDPEAPFGSRVVFASPSIREILNVSDVGNFGSWFEAVHPDDRAAVIEASTSAAAKTEPFGQTMRVIDGDGRVRWIRAVSYPVVDEYSAVTHYDGLMIDVTATVEAEQRARESEVRLARIFENAPVPLFEIKFADVADQPDPLTVSDVLRPNTAWHQSIDVLAANRAALRFMGASSVTDLNEQLSLVGLADAEAILTSAFTALAAGETFESELTHRRPSGELVDSIVSMSAHEPFDLTRVLVSLLDMTERRRADDELRLRDRAIAASTNAVVIADVSGDDWPVVYINPAFESITGYTEDEVLGSDHRLLFGLPNDRDELRLLTEAWSETRGAEAVVRSRHKDGSLYWGHVQTTPVQNERGETKHFLSVISDVTQAKDFEEELRYQANHDSLTGLPNRNLLPESIAEAITRARDHNQEVVVAFIDLDNFKYFNDTLGHDFGDRILIAMARRLESLLTESDTIARYGGDEFVLILTSPGSAVAAEGLLRSIGESVSLPLAIDDEKVQITCSIGFTAFPRDGDDPVRLLRNADAAMYDVKARGRNELAAYNRATGARFRERVSLESRLRQAIDGEEIFTLYQPIIDVRSGLMCGCEALARWRDPELGVISPDRFVPIAEETGLIVELGRAVLTQACRQGVEWSERGWPELSMAVNVSARQFHTGDIVNVVESALTESGLPAHRLVLELTESVLMPNARYAEKVLAVLKAMGIKLAIDDFGTGHSSLSYLTRFKVDSLKIDRMFLKDAGADAESATIVRAVANLGQTLGLGVIAEGVETLEQLELVSEIDCDAYQGYLVSPPVAAEEIAAYVGRPLP